MLFGGRRAVFGHILKHNLWKSGESVSGPGSDMRRTERVRAELPGVIRQFGIKTMLDAPCGDMNWISQLELDLDHYIGADIEPELIASNRRLHSGSGREFRVLDIVTDPLPRVDLIFCRDCLVHLSFAEVRAALDNFRRSTSVYLMATTFPTTSRNHDIVVGEWRPLNLQAQPFSLPEPLARIKEADAPMEKWLYLWRLSALTLT
jgi:hypothetical protein